MADEETETKPNVGGETKENQINLKVVGPVSPLHVSCRCSGDGLLRSASICFTSSSSTLRRLWYAGSVFPRVGVDGRPAGDLTPNHAVLYCRPTRKATQLQPPEPTPRRTSSPPQPDPGCVPAVHFRVKKTTALRKLMSAYCERQVHSTAS